MLLWRGIGTAAALQRYQQIGYRVSAHVGDVNAAGSYFGMIVCVALGMAMRNRGRRQVLWWCLAAASGAGLWFSESRSALGAAGAVVIVGMLWAATSRFRPQPRAAVLAVAVTALLGGAAVRAMLLEADPDYRGVGFRQQFVQTSVRMIAARPLFGVGEGRYYLSSPLFLSPELATSYGAENAHNFFLQVGGELGLVGLALFAIWLISPLARTARAVARAPRDARLLGVGGGVAAFIITCLTGHPFLVGEVAYPFWLLFGLMTALAGATLLSDTGRADGSRATRSTPPALRWLAAAAAIVILIASPITTAKGAVIPSESRAVNGFFEWETLADGTRFRWTGRYASLFVPADVTRVEIPVRLPTDGRSIPVMGVEAMTGGVGRGRTLVDATWAIISLPLAPVLPPIAVQADRPSHRSGLAAGAVHRRQRGHAQGWRAGRRTAALPRIAPRQISSAIPSTSSNRAPATRTAPSRRSAARDRSAAARLRGVERSGTSGAGDGIGCMPCCSNASIDRRMCSGEVTSTKSVRPRSASIRLTMIASSRVFFDSDSSTILAGLTPTAISARCSATDSGAAAASRSVTPPEAITSGPPSRSNSRATSSTRRPASNVTDDSWRPAARRLVLPDPSSTTTRAPRASAGEAIG